MSDSKNKKTVIEKLFDIFYEMSPVLFHDEFKNPYARLKNGNKFEIVSLQDTNLVSLFASLYFKQEQKTVSRSSITDMIEALKGDARAAKQYVLHNRVAMHDGKIFYDLTNDGWESIMIDEKGWQVVANPPILFNRWSHQQAQVTPDKGTKGNIKKIFDHINMPDEQDQVLFLSYLVSCFIPNIPHPVMIVHGEQGSAKSTFTKMVKKLVDPSGMETIAINKNIDDFVQQLSHHYMPSFDNVSKLAYEHSDTLCRAVTGEGVSKRALYTNDDMFIHKFQRCPVLNGINTVAARPDLLERSVLFGLKTIDPKNRKLEQVLNDNFEKDKQIILVGILDTIVSSLNIVNNVNLDAYPRMADFARWGCAIADALEIGQEVFMSAYQKNIALQSEEALDADVLATIVTQYMTDKAEISEPSSSLLSDIKKYADDNGMDYRADWGFPKSAPSLSKKLAQLVVPLRSLGIHVDVGYKNAKGERVIYIKNDTPDLSGNQGSLLNEPEF